MLSSLPRAVVANAIARAGNDSERYKPKGFNGTVVGTIRQIKYGEATRPLARNSVFFIKLSNLFVILATYYVFFRLIGRPRCAIHGKSESQ